MNRTYNRLTVVKVKKLAANRRPGMYPDGDGLYLAISPAGVASWSYRFMLAGRAREMGLGPLRDVALAQAPAREKAQAARQLRRQGIDPIEARGVEQQAAAAAKQIPSFESCAKGYIAAHRAGWKNARHAAQWISTLETYAYPVFGRLPLDAIDTAPVMQAIELIWLSKPETASRLRGRVESVLDWAAARGYRPGDALNPARWEGHIANLLPARAKVQRTAHHPSLHYSELPEFMAKLRHRDDNGARALAFAILTCARTDEALGARWDEFDLAARQWAIPAERMKGGRPHTVPLSDPVCAIFEQQASMRRNEYVFSGVTAERAGKHLLRTALRRLGRADLTVHGFRATFSTWAAEQTDFAYEVRETSLAHTVNSAVVAAYQRGDLFAKRSRLMAAWAGYCTSTSAGAVVPFQRSA